MSSTPSRKILFVVQHRFNRSPGQRYRCEQYIPYLEQQGFECTYSPIILNEKEDRGLYLSTSLIDKGLLFIKSFFRRCYDVWRARNFDIVFIYREAFPLGWIFFETMLAWSGARIVLDFDDAVWLPTVSEANKSFQWLKRPEKINDIIALSDLVIVGNTYLAQYAKRFNSNVVVFPSTINLDYYKLETNPSPDKKEHNNKIIIGWSGSHTTIGHFEIIIPVLKKLKNLYREKIGFVVYGDAHYKNEDLDIIGTAWSYETEVQVISSFDIGIMPLPNDEWSKGKCAMKGLQYMGLAVPAVMAAIGMNLDVAVEGKNGFLAKDENEWFDKLSRLIIDKELRRTIGLAGRETVERMFSCQAKHQEYVNIFLALCSEKG